jgi:outer membrane translocation and assembly module TamA
MRWIYICIIGFLIYNSQAQDLYLKISAPNNFQDSLINAEKSKFSFKDISTLNDEFKKIIESFELKGYYNLRYTDLKKINDSVFEFSLDLNRKYNYIKFNNHELFEDIFEDRAPYLESKDLSDFLYVILNYYSKQGKPFSQVKLKNIEFTDSDTVYADLHLDVSNTRILNDIVVKGYEKFPKAFISNYANIKTGKVFDRDDLVLKSEQIEELRFVNQKQSPQVQFTKDSTKLFLYLEKRQANSFDGFIGFNNSDNNQFQLNGNIDLRLVNNFHSGEEIQLNYKNDGNAQEWFDANLRLPYILRTKFSFQAGLGFFKQDSTFSNTTQYLKVDYQLKPDLNIGIKGAFENSSDLLDQDVSGGRITDFRKRKFGLDLSFNNPRRYNRLFLGSQSVSLGFGIGERETDIFSESQQYVELNARQIFKLHKRQFFYIGLNGAFLNSSEYFSNELYRFGGVNSMRGFIENRFFASLYGTIQTEYRYILGSNLYVHSVLDYGYYQNNIDSFDENLYSLGFGFGLETKAGVLRLILANGGSNSQSIEFRNTQIHIKFISVF